MCYTVSHQDSQSGFDIMTSVDNNIVSKVPYYIHHITFIDVCPGVRQPQVVDVMKTPLFKKLLIKNYTNLQWSS